VHLFQVVELNSLRFTESSSSSQPSLAFLLFAEDESKIFRFQQEGSLGFRHIEDLCISKSTIEKAGGVFRRIPP
jgi:hypothetical protein